MKRSAIAFAIVMGMTTATTGAHASLARVTTKSGHGSLVIASARTKFQGFINDLERAGHRIADIGCYSPTGHMPNSKHHWGGACDFNQRARNVTSGFMYHVTALAHKWGLKDGCEWQYRDCGHIEIPGPTYAHAHHRHRYARRSGFWG